MDQGITRMFGSHPVNAGAFDLERQLWNLDPRLQLHYATREHPFRRGVLGRAYEVRRHNEDGTESLIGRWKLEDFGRIWSDILVMKDGAEGRGPGVEAEIDAHNKAITDKLDQEYRDNLGEMMEHGARLWHDRNEPGNIFRGIPGLRDEPKVSDPDTSDTGVTHE